MSTYWKLGCNWGRGKPDFYEMMKARSLVICGGFPMAKGDLVAICKGFKVFAIVKILETPLPVTEYPELEISFQNYQIDFNNRNRISPTFWYELPVSDRFEYPLQQGICQIKNKTVLNRIQDYLPPLNKLQMDAYHEEQLQKYIELLEANKNIIFTGAPGTGKTYLAKQIARRLVGSEITENHSQCEFVQFHPSYDYTDFVEGLRPTQPDDNGTIGFKRQDGTFKLFCKRALKNWMDSRKTPSQLQEEISLEKNLSNFIGMVSEEIESKGEYEIRGIGGKKCAPIVAIDEKHFSVRTQSDTLISCSLNNILTQYDIFMEQLPHTFEDMKNVTNYHATYYYGFLKSFSDYVNSVSISVTAPIEKVKEQKFIFIIDEINRGEISKILGELFFSIDPGYRGKAGCVKTQYTNLIEEGDVFKKGFYIPDNVYIIGTMNDIDRSVESMDFAMRRRFAWIEIKATDRLAMWDGKIDTWKAEAEKRMAALNDKIEKIPGLSSAYHIGPAYFLKLEIYKGDFTKLWENHLRGVLSEYLRGIPNAVDILSDLKRVYNKEGADGTHNG